MELIILGSGTATPRLGRNASGVFVKTSGVNILVDMGPGILRRLCEAEIDYRQIDVVLLTHFHPDHVSDVAPFLFAHNYAHGAMRDDPFILTGPRGLEQLYKGLVSIYGSWVIPSKDRLMIKELADTVADSVFFNGVEVLSIPAQHSGPCISIRLNDREKSVTISGDTAYSEELASLAKLTDVFVCECSMPDQLAVKGHSTPSCAARMANLANAKKLVLTHFYPPCDEVDVISQASVFYNGPIVKSEDLLKIRV